MVKDNNKIQSHTSTADIDLDKLDASCLLELPAGVSQPEVVEAAFKAQYQKTFREMQMTRDDLHREALQVHIQALQDARNIMLGRAPVPKQDISIHTIII